MKCKYHGIKGCSRMECKTCPFLDTCIEESDREDYEWLKENKK